jgi:hypothetical protein
MTTVSPLRRPDHSAGEERPSDCEVRVGGCRRRSNVVLPRSYPLRPIVEIKACPKTK